MPSGGRHGTIWSPAPPRRGRIGIPFDKNPFKEEAAAFPVRTTFFRETTRIDSRFGLVWRCDGDPKGAPETALNEPDTAHANLHHS